MTLNITILTPTVIYQSGDYRLSNPTTGKAEDIPSTKAISINYWDWSGFLTYTGIGRVGPRHTADEVSDWLKNHPALTFEETVEILRERGSAWIARVAPGARHTFVLAAFVDSKPVAAIISNYQRWHGITDSAVAKEFFVTEVRPKRAADVIVTGVWAAVSRQQRRELQRLAEKHADEPLRVRTGISKTNRHAARNYPNLISEDCFIQSLDKHGRGQQESAGDSRTSPHVFMQGVDLLEMIRPFLEQRFGKDQWTVKASTSGSSKDHSSVPPPCELQLVNIRTRTDYRVTLLACLSGNRAQPRAINSMGAIVGDGTQVWRGPSFPCLWQASGEVLFLDHLGGLGGSAHGLTEAGTIVGATESPNRLSHACEWSPTGQLIDLGVAMPSHSGARAVNSAGCIVGWASLHPTEGGQDYFRPTLWNTDRVPCILYRFRNRQERIGHTDNGVRQSTSMKQVMSS